MSAPCDHFVPHTWKYNVCKVFLSPLSSPLVICPFNLVVCFLCLNWLPKLASSSLQVCGGPEKNHTTSAGLDPDVLLDNPELEIPPGRRGRASVSGKSEPIPSASPTSSTPTLPTSAPPPVPSTSSLAPPTPTTTTGRPSVGSRPSPSTTTVTSPQSGGSGQCTHFVPHMWKYNKCRVIYRCLPNFVDCWALCFLNATLMARGNWIDFMLMDLWACVCL